MGEASRSLVSTAIINYNGGPLLAACLDSVLAQGDAVAEVVVIDNRSTDGSVAQARRAHPSVRVVDIPRNSGYAGGANRAIAETRVGISSF